ncbi:MAG: hypothetical protein WAL46_03710, partial [Nitrososphaeraceae archaeon]
MINGNVHMNNIEMLCKSNDSNFQIKHSRRFRFEIKSKPYRKNSRSYFAIEFLLLEKILSY